MDRPTATLVGDAGFKGPPDEAGVGEVGYSIIPAFRQRGYATEALAGLIAWARLQPEIRLLRAEALAGNPASQRVLNRNGFVCVASYPDPEVGLMRRYELSLSTEAR